MVELLIFLIFFFLITILISYLLGNFISIHFNDDETQTKTKLQKIFDAIEKPIFKLCGVNPSYKMTSKEYFWALFSSNILLTVISYFCLYFQNLLPWKDMKNYQLDIPLILHILSSLITNTCQSHHIPELHLSHFSNYFIMPLLMFYSSASGIATGIVVLRGFTLSKIGNAYVDVIKAMTRILFPISFITSIIFSACGMPNTFRTSVTYETLEKAKETILLGPVAAFEAIKLFGENGLSCFGANSAHPFENPTYLSNFLQLVSIFIVPFALIFVIGIWLKNNKQAFVLLSVLVLVLLFEFISVTIIELKGNNNLNNILNLNFPNWVNKETRLGIVGTSILEAAISNVSGSNNSSLDSFHPIINLLGLFNLSNQSIFGVQGFGLVFTINFILYTAFFIGLMLGRTPEIFGKKIEKQEIILSSILLLINPFLVLIGTGVTLVLYPNNSPNLYEHAHYYTQVFYEFASGAASNGSGLEGLGDNTTYWNLTLAVVMFIARYVTMASMILLGGSVVAKPTIPINASTFRTDTIFFGIIFGFMSIISTLLVYFPFFILGPVTEMLLSG